MRAYLRGFAVFAGILLLVAVGVPVAGLVLWGAACLALNWGNWLFHAVGALHWLHPM